MAMMDVIPLDDQSKNMVIALMNAEHPDAIRLYAQHFANHREAVAAVLVDVQHSDFKIRVHFPGRAHGSQRTEEVTLPYVQADGSSLSIATIGDCRRAMVGMARIAAEALGEDIELPAALPAPAAGGEPPNLEALQQVMEAMRTAQSAQTAQEPAAEPADVRPQPVNQGSVVAASSIFAGQGSRLGAATGNPSVVEAASVSLREVDPEQPYVRLRVQLLDRRHAQVVVNKDFTMRDVLVWLQHYQGDTRPFHLLNVASFPPTRLGNMDATVEQLGLTKASALSCRPA